MEYPFFEVPLIGGGLLIGAVAIVHVFISHFAVGGGLYLVLTELKAYREKSESILKYVKTHALFFILLTLVLGAITGVGIWFTIGLVHPAATSTLIRAFVWAWGIEWVFFFIEIAAAFFYYYAWGRVSRKTHLAFGWVYFAAAWLSLVIINGILSFMLTPGQWINTKGFWDGFLNPSYLSSVFVRTAVAVNLAGIYGLVTSSLIKGDEKTRASLIKYNARWLLTGFLILPFAGLWYVSQIPDTARFIFMGGAAAVTLFAAATIFLSAIIAVFTWAGPYRNPRGFSTGYAFLLMVLAFLVTGVAEWSREAVRKPYVIYQYMYSNGIPADEYTKISWGQEGILPHSRWSSVKAVFPYDGTERQLAAGRELFRLQCGHCHTIDGYNGVRPLVYGWNRIDGFTDSQLKHLDSLKPFMPPFHGTPLERRALARWLDSLNKDGKGAGK